MISAARRTLVVAIVAVAGCGGGSGDEPAAPLVATLGDSITAGAPRWSPNPVFRQLLARRRPTPRSQWQYWAERELDGAFRFRNCGVEGDRTDEIELRFERCVDGAEAVVLQGGTNDVIQGHAPAMAAVNLRGMVRRAKDAGLRTFVTTVPPLNRGHPRWAAEIRRLNELIRAIARQEEVPVLDFYALLEDPRRPGRMRPRWTADGVHPSVEGYGRLGSAAARELE